MKKIVFFIALLVGMLSTAQQEDVKSAFLEKWNNSKEYLIEIAQAMPEDKYDFKPTERQMSFKTQLIHIHGNMKWLGTNYFDLEGYNESEDLTKLSKEELLSILQNTFDSIYTSVEKTDVETLKDEVEFFAGPKTRLQMLNLLQDHVTHHRGQLVVYLNLCDVELPRYTGW